MEFLVQVKSQFSSNRAVFTVKTIPDLGKSVCQCSKRTIIIWFYHEIMGRKLFKIQCLLYEFTVLLKILIILLTSIVSKEIKFMVAARATDFQLNQVYFFNKVRELDAFCLRCVENLDHLVQLRETSVNRGM